MNIISRIKSWFEPKVEEPAKKATIRFRKGMVLMYTRPPYADNGVSLALDEFIYANRDREADRRTGELMRNRLMKAHPLTQIRQHNNQCGSFSQITMNDIMGRW